MASRVHEWKDNEEAEEACNDRSVPLPIAMLSIAESFRGHPAMAIRMHRPSCAISGARESLFWHAVSLERNLRQVKGRIAAVKLRRIYARPILLRLILE